jgi:hypothetical protein
MLCDLSVASFQFTGWAGRVTSPIQPLRLSSFRLDKASHNDDNLCHCTDNADAPFDPGTAAEARLEA